MATKITREGIAQLLYNAGFRGQSLVDMVAIAMRESGGNPQAFNGNADTGDQSYGLWQINMIGDMGPARRKQFGITKNEDLYDPATAAKAAFILSGGGAKLDPWGAYKGQANTYATDVPAARVAVSNAGLPADWNQGGPAVSTTDPFAGDTTPISDGSGAPGTGSAEEHPALKPDATPEEIRAYVRDNYGYMVAYLDHAELGPIIIDAAQRGWGPDKIVNQMMATQWWHDTTASVRLWEKEIFSDPATAQTKRDARFKMVRDMVRSMGITLTDVQTEKISEDSLKFAWDSNTINEVILGHRDKTNANVVPGNLSAIADQIKAIYRQQLMPVTDTGATSMAAKVLKQETTMEAIRSGVQTQTLARFSQNAGLSAWVQGGNNAADYFASSKATVARELEVDEANIDLMAKEWGWVIEVPDGKGGQRQPTPAEVQKRARQDKRAVQTNGFRESMGAIASQMSSAMGF